MRNLYEIFDKNIEKEEKRIESEKEQIIKDKIKYSYEKIESVKDTSDLYDYLGNLFEIIREIVYIIYDYKLKNNSNAACKFEQILDDFKLKSNRRLYSTIILSPNPDNYYAVFLMFLTIEGVVPRNTTPILDEDIEDPVENILKNITENSLKKLGNTINIESENNKIRRNYAINEIRGYYTYKLFIQMLMDRLYMESTNNPDGEILDREITFTFKILLSKVLEKDDKNNTIKLPTDVEIHFIEFIKLFVERNNFKNTNISNNMPNNMPNNIPNMPKMTYYVKAKVKDLLDACYREIQGFEYTDKLIEETVYDENIIFDKDSENPLTLKIE